MIDINKKYRTRRGGEVVGLVKKGDALLGWEAHNNKTLPRIWYDNGKYACEESPEDLIEINEQEQLLEEARRRCPVGTQIRQYIGYKALTVVGGPFWEEGKILVKVEDGRNIWIWNDRGWGDFGQWAEILLILFLRSI